MKSGPYALTFVLIASIPALAGCESCRETFIPPPPQDSPPPAYEIGLVPAELRQTLHWPVRPRTSERAELTSTPNGPWMQSGVNLAVRGQLGELVIAADDVDISAADGAYVGTLVITAGHRRIRIGGGAYGQIVLEAPTSLIEPPPEWRAEDMIEDVIIDGVTIDAVSAGLSGALLRGRRLALINSRVDAQFHAVLVADTAPVPSEEVVLAGCSLFSAGDESTLVLSDVRRAVVVDTWIENGARAGVRIHGESEWVVLRSNTVVGGGVAIGTAERDDVAHPWFWLNTMHHSVGDLLQLEPGRIRDLVLANNTLYSGSEMCAWCGPTPGSWLVVSNDVRAYVAAPPRP